MKYKVKTNKVRIKDVANAAGVSVGTVSMALRNDPRVGDQQLEHVKTVASKMGYHSPSQVFQKQAMAQAGIERVGVVFLGNSGASPLLHALSTVCMKRKIRLEVLTTGAASEEQTEEMVLSFASKLDGLILTDFVHPHLLRSLHREGVGYSVLGWIHCEPGEAVESELLHLVTSDDTHAARHATTWLLAQGHTRVAFLSGALFMGLYNQRWYDGYRLALADAGIAEGPCVITHKTTAPERLGGAMRALFRDYDESLGFLMPSVSLAQALLTSADAEGVTIPSHSLVIGDDAQAVRAAGLERFPSLGPDYTLLCQVALNRLQQTNMGMDFLEGMMLIPCQFSKSDG